MIIKSAEFIKSAFKKEHFINDNFPQIAFSGRSNCGKSTLINALLNRKKLVKTSSKPGHTQSINYFLINNQFYLVDFPGFGFAKASKKLQLNWDKLITDYLKNTEQLRGVIHLVDIRRLLTEKDEMLIEFLEHFEIPFLIVLTKADKLSNNEITKSLKSMKNRWNIEEPLVVSALKKRGMEELWNQIEMVIEDED
jgi:GTP-binding protein